MQDTLLEQFEIDSSEYESLISESSYLEFCNDVDNLKLFIHEAVEDNSSTAKPQVKRNKLSTVKNTLHTMRSIKKIHSDITDVGGATIKLYFDTVIKGLSMITKVLSFLINNIVKLEKGVERCIKTVKSIPPTVTRKIKGNLEINIRPSDIRDMYKLNIIKYMNYFMIAADEFSKGEVWTTFFGKEINGGIHLKDIGRNDKKSYKNMKDYYQLIKKVKITKSIVDMSNRNVVDVYFGNSKAVSFTDVAGKNHDVTYLEGLLILIKDLEKYNKVLNGLQTQISNKIDKTKLNGTYDKLPGDMKEYIRSGVIMISGALSLLGDIVKYSIADVNSINSATKSILKKYKLTGNVKK